MHTYCDELKIRLHRAGLKLTPQRMVVMQALIAVKTHPDAQSIYDAVKKIMPQMSLATVYTALKTLESAGIIRQVGARGDIQRFDGNLKPHSHLMCINCNKIQDLEDFGLKDISSLESTVIEKTDYKLVNTFVNFYGYCPQCKLKLKNSGLGRCKGHKHG